MRGCTYRFVDKNAEGKAFLRKPVKGEMFGQEHLTGHGDFTHMTWVNGIDTLELTAGLRDAHVKAQTSFLCQHVQDAARSGEQKLPSEEGTVEKKKRDKAL